MPCPHKSHGPCDSSVWPLVWVKGRSNLCIRELVRIPIRKALDSGQLLTKILYRGV